MSIVLFLAKSIRALSAGASMITKLAVGLVLYSTPVTFGLPGLSGQIANAGFTTLCADATTNLIEQEGDVTRALRAMEKNGLGKNLARNMLSTALLGTGGLPSGAGFGDYLAKAALQSAVNTALAVAIDNEDFKEALKQGAVNAGLNAASGWMAANIGDAHDATKSANPTHGIIHISSHFAAAAVAGAFKAALLGGDIKLTALSQGGGAALGHMAAEAAVSLGMETGMATQVGNFTAAVAAVAMDLDVNAAYLGSSIATQYR